MAAGSREDEERNPLPMLAREGLIGVSGKAPEWPDSCRRLREAP